MRKTIINLLALLCGVATTFAFDYLYFHLMLAINPSKVVGSACDSLALGISIFILLLSFTFYKEKIEQL